jgi:hypothetical protein
LSYYVTGQKPGGGTTSHAKMLAEQKFNDYTQNSSEKQSKFKNKPKNYSIA